MGSVAQWLRRAGADLAASLPPLHPAAGLSADEQRRRAEAEAEQLLRWATGWTRAEMLLHWADPLPVDAADQLSEAVSRRAAGEPLQYIVGAAGFFGRTFVVRPGCLIPRPETEILVEAAVRLAQAHRWQGACADLGTGSGAIAVTLKLECPQLCVTGVDISEVALAVARENGHRLEADVRWVHADGVEWLKQWPMRSGDAGLHLLVANPPYIPTGHLGDLAAEVRAHEPALALDGGPDGLNFYRRLAEVGYAAFAPRSAAVLLEVGAGQAPAVAELFRTRWLGWTWQIVPDLRGIGRVVQGVWE
ncbi:MAG: peptide chain release factor N(5)-glutamine methyltransferase [Alicyclobacillus sp.]|nr:peptide chain release factor N(5)-glutamine methyltransferase [Alicyclobacillus sp.]